MGKNWEGGGKKPHVYGEKVLLHLIHLFNLNFTFILSLNLQEMFKSIAITLCRVFITQ